MKDSAGRVTKNGQQTHTNSNSKKITIGVSSFSIRFSETTQLRLNNIPLSATTFSITHLFCVNYAKTCCA
jgi:hypothetical protein